MSSAQKPSTTYRATFSGGGGAATYTDCKDMLAAAVRAEHDADKASDRLGKEVAVVSLARTQAAVDRLLYFG